MSLHIYVSLTTEAKDHSLTDALSNMWPGTNPVLSNMDKVHTHFKHQIYLQGIITILIASYYLPFLHRDVHDTLNTILNPQT